MKLITTNHKKKKAQYIVSGIIALIILILWITIPLSDKSKWDVAVSNPYGMSKKSADLSLLDSSGVDAPGFPLTGALIDNPATKMDLEASSLFKMPENEEIYEEKSENNSNENNAGYSSDLLPNPPNINSPNAGDYVKGKLNKLPSIAGGNSQTMTFGGVHNKFFGQETAKADLVPLNSKISDEIKSAKKNTALEALQHVERQSTKALEAKNNDESRGAATSAFEKSQKSDALSLNSKEEKEAYQSGLELSKVDSDLKKNDPAISHKKIALPQPKKDEDESQKMEEEIKKMLLQMIIQATVGQVFGTMGQMMAMTMCPQCYKKGTSSD